MHNAAGSMKIAGRLIIHVFFFFFFYYLFVMQGPLVLRAKDGERKKNVTGTTPTGVAPVPSTE